METISPADWVMVLGILVFSIIAVYLTWDTLIAPFVSLRKIFNLSVTCYYCGIDLPARAAATKIIGRGSCSETDWSRDVWCCSKCYGGM